MKPAPIIHLDLKPGNIMVTHDNRLVVVDFGIARRYGEEIPGGMTATYAAPEQFAGHMFNKYAQLVNERFGGIPHFAGRQPPDARSDIYSLGVIMFELATGMSPTLRNMDVLSSFVSEEFGAIIRKCLEVYPEERYQSAEQLLDDLRNVKGTSRKMAGALTNRKHSAIAACVSLLLSGSTFAGGFYVFNEENAAIIDARPEVVIVSLYQSSEFAISKQMRNGRMVYLDSHQIIWDNYRDNVARIEGNRVQGINLGRTTLRGSYRNNEISLTVRVVEPLDGLTSVSQRYETGRFVSLLAGSSVRSRTDGPLDTANFMSPESITVTDDGTVYISDAGEIRMISDGMVSTVEIPVDYIKAAMLRSFENELYILSNPWQDGNKYFYALARLGGRGLEAIYIADASYTFVEDFCFDDRGLLFFIERNEGLGGVFLKTIDLYDVEDINTLHRLPHGSTSLTVADNGDVYIGNTETGIIHRFRDGELSYFAGVVDDRAFIDGVSPRFYSPQRIQHRSGFLYIWDFNTLRRIEASRGVAGESITIAGIANPHFDTELDESRIRAEDVVLPYGRLMDFALSGREVLLTDHKRGVVWVIN